MPGRLDAGVGKIEYNGIGRIKHFKNEFAINHCLVLKRLYRLAKHNISQEIPFQGCGLNVHLKEISTKQDQNLGEVVLYITIMIKAKMPRSLCFKTKVKF